MGFNHGLENPARQKPHQLTCFLGKAPLSPPPVLFMPLDFYTGPDFLFINLREILQCQRTLTWVISLSSYWFFLLASVSGALSEAPLDGRSECLLSFLLRLQAERAAL